MSAAGASGFVERLWSADARIITIGIRFVQKPALLRQMLDAIDAEATRRRLS